MLQKITTKIQSEIIRYTSFLSQEYHSDYCTDLIAICRNEGIEIHCDDYGTSFDGCLVFDAPKFHIHLNISKGNLLSSNRGRYTLAHELGHYFIDSHRVSLRQGLIKPHPSKMTLFHTDKMEIEANYFASNLLMPKNVLRKFSGGRKFSFNIIKEISTAFNVSITSAVIQFSAIGTHEIFATFSEQKNVKWFVRSSDFPNLPLRFKVGGILPETTVVGEFFNKPDCKYTSVEKVFIEDWFYKNKYSPSYQLYEQCFYCDVYGYVISLVWFE